MKNNCSILFLGIILLGSLSCIKKPLEEQEKPASLAEVQAALSKAWGQADPLTMAPNDFLFQETEQKIENNPVPFFVLQEGITISKKEELADEFLYTFLYQNKAISQGSEGKQSTREDHRSVGKPTANLTANQALPFAAIKPMATDYQMSLGFERLYGLAYACVKSDSLALYCKEQLAVDSCEVECSNLKITESKTPAPELIKAQENCGGFKDCSLKTIKVDFDWAILLKKGEGVEKQKVNYSVSLSPDLPFFSRMTEYCYRQLYPVQTQKVLVTTCTKLKNFKPGSP